MISLAFSIHSTPGVYAVLLGSGVSRSAQIPTGWQIVLDLCEKLAAAHGENTKGSPDRWYTEKFGLEVRYDDLLETICSTPDERQALLKQYFEQTEATRESGHKLPTPAHKAIAWLVKMGYIRVILTTNFDPLMEMALQEEGVSFDVASTEDALKGIRPIIHSNCTIIKIHGDYRDTRIRNTPEELSVYPDEVNTVLDRILDEFGLIVAGWSGEWDEALKKAMYRAINRRYSWFWLAVGGVSEAAERLIQHRHAKVIRMDGADNFFEALRNQIEGISNAQKNHPLTFDLALALSKKLVSTNQNILLQDVINEESATVRNRILDMSLSGVQDEFLMQVEQYPHITSKLLGLIIPLAAFGDDPLHHEIYKNALSRIGGSLPLKGGSTWLIQLRHYPALLTMYAAGISAIAYKRYDWLKTILLHRGRYKSNERSLVTFISEHHVYSVFSSSEKILPGRIPNAYTPASEHLFETLQPYLKSILPTIEEYTDSFDLFEWLLSVIYIGHHEHYLGPWTPIGCYTWRSGFRPLLENLLQDGAMLEEQWSLIVELFGGNIQLFRDSLTKTDEFLLHTRIRPYENLVPMLSMYKQSSE
ncbi:SIR2 family protein [Cohnella cholangitidis]|nr:SIR2 family protein [Cohnella cholangitidis]